VNGLVARYELWDHIAAAASFAIQALNSTDGLIARGLNGYSSRRVRPYFLLYVRPYIQRRHWSVVAWQRDTVSLPLLREFLQSHPQVQPLIDWAMQKIEVLSFDMQSNEGKANLK
jgi:hypothetical protein